MKVLFVLETSCEDRKINPYYNMESIKIEAVKVKDGHVVDEFEIFIKPEYVDKLTPFCTKQTGVVYDDLKNAPMFGHAILEFYAFFYGCTIYSYGEYARKFLIRELNEKGVNLAHGMTKNAINSAHVNLRKLHEKTMMCNAVSLSDLTERGRAERNAECHKGASALENLTNIYFEIEAARERMINDKLKGERIDEVVKSMNFIHNENIHRLNDKVIYDGKENSPLNFVEDWKDVILRDYESGRVYINNEEYELIKVVG